MAGDNRACLNRGFDVHGALNHRMDSEPQQDRQPGCTGLPESALKRALQSQPKGVPQLKIRTKFRSASGSSNSFSDLAKLTATPHSFRSESSLLSRSSEPISIPDCRLHSLSPSAQIMEEAAASYAEAYRDGDNTAASLPQAHAACQVPADFLRELELWLQQSQDASLETVQSLRLELEQRSHLLEDCITLCQRQESDLCFDLE